MVGGVLDECYAHCTLQTTAVDFVKEYEHGNRYKRLNISPPPYSICILFQWSVNSCYSGCAIHFLVERVFILDMFEIFAIDWSIINHQQNHVIKSILKCTAYYI
jgi:hypothetical protein